MSDPHERTLAIFDAFLRYARGGGEVARREEPSAPAPLPPAPPPASPPAAPPARTFDEETTRVSRVSQAMASALAPLPERGSPWEEPTQERPDVVRELRASEAALAAADEDLTLTQPDAPPWPAAPAAHRDERSIIVDDDAYTEPEFSRATLSPVLAEAAGLVPGAPLPVEHFVEEMAVLIKYGHAMQAAELTERWLAAHPDDLTAHRRVAEFELAWLDRDRAIRRFVALVGRLLDQGERSIAGELVRSLRRDAPDDARVGALVNRVGQP